MTTGNDPAQPNPTDQTPAPSPAAINETAAQAIVDRTAAAAERMADDPDLIELAAAKEALKVEESAPDAGGEPAQVEGTPPTPTPPAAAPARAPAQAVPMIPKPRFDEVNNRASKAEQEAAYWRGQAEARALQPQPGQQTTLQPQPSPQDRLATIRTAIDDLAGKFDAGEITMADLKKQERALVDQETQIREEMLLSKVPKAAPAPAPQSGNELYLDTLTASLENQHPWVMIFDKVGTDADWGFLKSRAIENITQRGIDPTKGDIGRYELRKEMAELADELGPGLVAGKATAQGIVLPGHTTAQQQPARPSAQAQARAAKLTAQAGAPPNLNNMRGTGDDPATPTASRLETMTDEEIGALPQSVRNKILGITA